jgi:ribonucleoside-triphosphate reductase
MIKTKLTQIEKRDGRLANFTPEKVIIAINKALLAVGEPDEKLAVDIAKKVVQQIEKELPEDKIPQVEMIQDKVEELLMRQGKFKAAKAYILYRDQHEKIRTIKSFINSDELMEGYLNQIDWRVRENSNMAYSLQGLNNHVASSISAHYWLNKIYPPEVRDAHLKGDFHIHDLQTLAVYCCGWDIKDILLNGFGGVEAKIESKPPKHFRTALGQVVNFFYTLQGEAAGAQALANFDTYLAPFIYYDQLSYPEVKQALQEFVFNMNVPTRVGFQTPFTNLTFDLKPSKQIGEESVIIGGKIMNKKYNDFQKEMDMLNRAFTEVMIAGDAKGRVFTFPIPTYNVTQEFDWNNPNYDLIWEMTAKYGIPYYSNFINSDMDPDDARSMCCRLRLDNRELRKRGGGLFAANPLTGSIGVVTVNLPRIGYLAQDKKDFFNKLTRMLDLARESLEIKRAILEKFTEEGLYPYSKFYLRDIKKRFNSYWKNHFNTIGINGMNECLINFLGKDISTEEGKEFALKVMDFISEKLANFQAKDNNLFNLEATPAEGAAYRFAKRDKELYTDIVVANEKAFQDHDASPYYTNSTNLPVNYTNDIFEALDHQDDFQVRYSGGTVLHGFVGERLTDKEMCKRLIKKIAQNYHLPYYTITPTFSICPIHGYINGEYEFCPKCDEEMGYNDITKNAQQKISF